MLIVIVIIGILSITFIPKILHAQARTRNIKRTIDIQQLANGLSQYRSFEWLFPMSLKSLINKKIMISLPTDPNLPNMDEPCVWNQYSSIYRWTDVGRSTSWWYYNYANYDIEHVEQSFAYNGYMYYYSNNQWIAILQTRMEIDGTKNAHIEPAIGCGWIRANREEPTTMTHIQYVSEIGKNSPNEKWWFFVRPVFK